MIGNMEISYRILAIVWLTAMFSCSARAEKLRVLYLGDSLSMGAFGKKLDSGMRAEGLEVYTYVAGGASPYYWLEAYQSLPSTIGFWEKTPTNERRVGYVRAVPKLEPLIEEHGPYIVIVQTGINLYATLRSRRKPRDENVLEVRSLIDQMCHSIAKAGARSYWILPPHSHERRYNHELQIELASIMRRVIREYGGAIFESREVTRFTDPYPATDGIHYGPEESEAWGEKVLADFINYSRSLRTGDPVASRDRDGEKRSLLVIPVSSSPSSQAPAAPEMEPDPLEDLASATKPSRDRLELELRLTAKSTIEDAAEIDYRNALGIYEYEVIRDRLGNYPFERIRVAHSILFRRKLTSAALREVGSTISLSLVPLSTYANLQTWQKVDDLKPNFDLTIYTPRLE